MKVLIVGECFSDNLGDPIISDSVVFILKKIIKVNEISYYDLSGRKNFIKYDEEKSKITSARLSTIKQKLSKWITKYFVDFEYLRFKKAYLKQRSASNYSITAKDYDLILFSGGQLLRDTFIFQINKIVMEAEESGIPIIFNAVGYGETNSLKMRELLSETLNSKIIKQISSRDDVVSINGYLDEKKAIKTYDPAIFISDVYNINKKNSDVIGLGIMYFHKVSLRDNIDFWRNIILILNDKGIEWRMFCNGPIKDFQLAHMILKDLGLKNKENMLIDYRPEKPQELVKIISCYNAIISFRLHSHIIAYSLNIPSIAINWDDKVRQFYRGIGLEDRCFELSENPVEIVKMLCEIKRSSYDLVLMDEQKENILKTMKKGLRSI